MDIKIYVEIYRYIYIYICVCIYICVSSRRAGYSAIQVELAKNFGSQCGFCSPGMVMSMYRCVFCVVSCDAMTKCFFFFC